MFIVVFTFLIHFYSSIGKKEKEGDRKMKEKDSKEERERK